MTPARAGRGGASLARPGQSATVNAVPTLEQVGRCQSDLTGDAFAYNFSPHHKKALIFACKWVFAHEAHGSHICMQTGLRTKPTVLVMTAARNAPLGAGVSGTKAIIRYPEGKSLTMII